MQRLNVALLGGSGFVGSHVAHCLDGAGYKVRVLTRKRESAKHLILLPNVEVVECDIRDDEALRQGLKGADAVINLVGILHERRGARFYDIHAEFPRRVVEACRHQSITRLLHVSALRAGPHAPSLYLRTKGEGEAAVRKSGLQWTLFKPSVVFGSGDSFMTLFARLSKMMPVLFRACPDARFQPVWVEDLARAVVLSLDHPATLGQTYNLCGPRQYTLRELVAYAASCAGARPRIIGLNRILSKLQATFMELLPIQLMTRDNVRSMQIDSICDCDFPAVFEIVPTPLEAVAPSYLQGDTPRAGYLRFRTFAGR